MEKDEDYIRQVKNLGDAVEQSIMQNYAIDIYQVGARGIRRATGAEWTSGGPGVGSAAAERQRERATLGDGAAARVAKQAAPRDRLGWYWGV